MNRRPGTRLAVEHFPTDGRTGSFHRRLRDNMREFSVARPQSHPHRAECVRPHSLEARTGKRRPCAPGHVREGDDMTCAITRPFINPAHRRRHIRHMSVRLHPSHVPRKASGTATQANSRFRFSRSSWAPPPDSRTARSAHRGQSAEPAISCRSVPAVDVHSVQRRRNSCRAHREAKLTPSAGSLPAGKGALHGTRTAVHGTRNWGSIGSHRWLGSTAGCDWGETCDRLRMAPIR